MRKGNMNLFGLNDVSENERREIARRSLNNLLTSYADEADVFTEIIQNAFDAVLAARYKNLYRGGESPRLAVVIGRRTQGHHYMFISDNGVGMSPEVIGKITVPGYSNGKKKGKTLGYKGVGASYFFAASQKIAIKSIDESGTATQYTVRGSYDWIKHEEEREPEIDDTFEIPESLAALAPTSRGTAVYFQFHEGIKPKNLGGLVVMGNGPDAELRNWMCFLATKTALGIVDPSHSDVTIDAYLDLGEDDLTHQRWRMGDFDRDNLVIGYPFPHKVLRVAKLIDEIESTPDGQRRSFDRRFQAVYKRWTTEQIIDATGTLDDPERQILRDHLNWVDGYLSYSTEVMRTVNERLGARAHIVRHGMKIIVDGVPQGRNVDLSLTSNQGLDRQSHIVLAFKGLELDTGRKISADEVIVSAINKIGRRVVDVMKDYRWAMRKKDRPDISSDLNTWRAGIEERAQISLVRELYKKSSLTPVFRVDPVLESEVIGLFVSLLANGLLKGYLIQAISGFARYDSLADIDSESPAVRDLDDSLSVRSNDLSNLNGKSKVLEFKYSFNDLLEDFDDRTKNPGEIDFVVCWSVPGLNVVRGRLEPTYGDWRDSRSIYAGSYVWYDENDTSKIPVISLKNVVAELLAKAEQAVNRPAIGAGTFAEVQAMDRDALV
jgi:hypothetical protein